MSPTTVTKKQASDLDETLSDPVLFANKAMGSSVWEDQAWILRSVANHSRTAVKACHASGKTHAAVLAVLWWITRHKDGIAVTTAPTWLQVERVIWGTLRKVIASGGMAFPKANQADMQLSPDNYAIGISTNEADRFSGFHGPHVLMILDEGPGVRPQIYEAIEGIRAGGEVKVLTIGNPVAAGGPFHEAFTTQRDSWNLRTIGAFDTPNLSPLMANLPTSSTDEEKVERLLALSEKDLDENIRPYLTTRRWVKEKWFEWGQHRSPLWDSRVMGRFPAQDPEALYPLSYLEYAKARENTRINRGACPSIGIDVAGPGEDETAMYVLEGGDIVEFHFWNNPDARGDCLRVLNTWKSHQPVVNIDSVGMGHYFAQHIADAGFNVNPINVGTSSSDPDRFVNLKAQLYWHFREKLEEGVVNGLTDELTISQLTTIRSKYDPKGKLVIEPKKDMVKRGIASPDRAEALILAFAGDQAYEPFACV